MEMEYKGNYRHGILRNMLCFIIIMTAHTAYCNAVKSLNMKFVQSQMGREKRALN